MTAPYRMFSLIEGCPSSQMEGANTNRGEMGAATRYVTGWMDANPGRWFMVGEMLDRKNDFLGVLHTGLRKFGYEAEIVDRKIYARLPHHSGIPLVELVGVPQQHGRPEASPDFKLDSFNWSLDELRTAASVAREWLRGADAYAQAA